MTVESGLSDRLKPMLDYAMNDLTASYRLDLLRLREKYRRRGALGNREYAMALVVLLDELTDASLRQLIPKLGTLTAEIPSEQMAMLIDMITERYRRCLDQIITAVMEDELVKHGLVLPLDRVADYLADHVRRSLRKHSWCLYREDGPQH